MTQKPTLVKAVKTAAFKLHNPSRRKRAMLDYALLHYHLAYSKALAAVQPDIERLVTEERERRENEKGLASKKKNENKNAMTPCMQKSTA